MSSSTKVDVMDEAYNPNDPLFLLSQSLDETLSDEQRQVVDTWLAQSPGAREQAHELRAVVGLMRGWSAVALPDEVCGNATFLERTLDRIADDAGSDSSDDLDHLLRRWADHPIGVDQNRFVADVVERIAPIREVSPVRRMVWRLGVPMAAAAMLALAVLGTFRLQSEWAPRAVVMVGPVNMTSASGDRSDDKPRALVTFARTALAMHDPPPRIGFISVGATAPLRSGRVDPPL